MSWTCCRCGNCQIQLSDNTIGYVDPVVVKRFLTQALLTAKKQAAHECAVAAIDLPFCWISCRGEIRSLTFDLIGPALPREAQRRENMTKVFEAGQKYITCRASLRSSDTCLETIINTLSTDGMEEGIRHMQASRSIRLRDMIRYFGVVDLE